MEPFYRRILVGIDGSEVANKAFKKALSLARLSQGYVIVCHIVENNLTGSWELSSSNPDFIQKEVHIGEQLLKSCLTYAQNQEYSKIEIHEDYGDAKLLIANTLPEKYHADLIVIGQSGLNAVEKMMMGSVASYTIKNATCDCLVVC